MTEGYEARVMLEVRNRGFKKTWKSNRIDRIWQKLDESRHMDSINQGMMQRSIWNKGSPISMPSSEGNLSESISV